MLKNKVDFIVSLNYSVPTKVLLLCPVSPPTHSQADESNIPTQVHFSCVSPQNIKMYFISSTRALKEPPLVSVAEFKF